MDALRAAKARALELLVDGPARVQPKHRKIRRGGKRRAPSTALPGNEATVEHLDADFDVALDAPPDIPEELRPALRRLTAADDANARQEPLADDAQQKAELLGDDEDDPGGATGKLEWPPTVRPTFKKRRSRRERKEDLHVSVAQLKTFVARPSLVEAWDVHSSDPHLLLQLKASANTVPVPVHWRNKRAYLQNKRGLDKRPFQLPLFIQETGIAKMRQAYQEMDATKSLKQKQRDRVRPKMGKVDIDYQILHDAFFKFQTKPRLTPSGDLYYELRELEPDFQNTFRPGFLSPELRVALEMDWSAGGMRNAPPPWLLNMQRIGPPPAYPNLRIPGLNAPIPPGASFGYHPGGWGRPPVDAYGNALYGDVFGGGQGPQFAAKRFKVNQSERKVLWGVLLQDEEDEVEFESGDLEIDDDHATGESSESPVHARGESQTQGIESTVSQLAEVPNTVNLRKS